MAVFDRFSKPGLWKCLIGSVSEPGLWQCLIGSVSPVCGSV